MANRILPDHDSKINPRQTEWIFPILIALILLALILMGLAGGAL